MAEIAFLPWFPSNGQSLQSTKYVFFHLKPLIGLPLSHVRLKEPVLPPSFFLPLTFLVESSYEFATRMFLHGRPPLAPFRSCRWALFLILFLAIDCGLSSLPSSFKRGIRNVYLARSSRSPCRSPLFPRSLLERAAPSLSPFDHEEHRTPTFEVMGFLAGLIGF